MTIFKRFRLIFLPILVFFFWFLIVFQLKILHTTSSQNKFHSNKNDFHKVLLHQNTSLLLYHVAKNAKVDHVILQDGMRQTVMYVRKTVKMQGSN